MMTTITTDENNWFNINYVEQTAYHTHFIPLLDNKRVANYCERKVSRFLSHIGFSRLFCESFSDRAHLDFDTFHQKFDAEIKEVYNKNLLQVIAGKYFADYVVPSVPPSELVMDIGCGTGTLVKELANSHKFNKVIGCDLNSCPEWKDIVQGSHNMIEFNVVKEDEFVAFIKAKKPDALIFTFVLHHMELPIQHKYIKNLFDMMHPGARLVILEDTYSTTSVPEFGQEEQEKFMSLSQEERKDVLTINDWVENVFIARRAMPIPSTYRTLEEWESFFSEIGFDIVSNRFIGWPPIELVRPQGLLVLEKPSTDV